MKLNPKQHKAIPLLASCEMKWGAAGAVSVSPQTISEWFRNTDKLSGDSLTQKRLRLAQYEGLNAVLPYLNPIEKKNVLNLLQPFKSEWLKPEELWSQVPALLDGLVHPELIENGE